MSIRFVLTCPYTLLAVKLPWKNKDANPETHSTGVEHTVSAKSEQAADSAATQQHRGSAYTPKKGRPTPKRNDVERAHGVRRGPVEAPLTAKEARQRRKEHKASLSKEELKAEKAAERAERREQRRIADERIAAGDPKYLLPRDQGPERKLVRDWVDTRRFLANIFLPFALVLLLLMLISSSMPRVANIVSILALVLIIALFIEGIFIGRRAMKVVREHYPKTSEGAWSLGFYAYSRASQPRRLRTPRPQKEIGDSIR